MEHKKETPVSGMDDSTLQMHALAVAYRDAERRCEDAEERERKLKREARDLEAQLQELTEAYQTLPQGMGEELKACPLQLEDYQNLAKELDSIIETLKKK